MSGIGVFGGSFDPVHNGHVMLAREAMRRMALDLIIAVPAKLQPLKRGMSMASGEHRVKMLELAFCPEDRVTVSGIELLRGGASYTVDTLRELRGAYDGAEMHFILGADAFMKVGIWKGAEELLRDYSFIIGGRPGCLACELEGLIAGLGARAEVLDNDLMEVSSTDVRGMLREGRAGAAVPAEVEGYIRAHGLYQ